MHGLGRVYMEPKGHIVLDRYKGEWEVMPSYIEEPEAAACKWVSIREDNAKYDLPTVFSILVYTHPETGFPLAICDGVAPHDDAYRLLRGGLGEVARAQGLEGARRSSARARVGQGVLATCEPVFPWEEVRVWSRSAGGGRPVPREPGAALSRPAITGVDRSRAGRARRRRRRHRHARARLDRRRRVDLRPARISPLSAPTSRASRSSTRGSSSGRASSSTTSASAVPDGEINVALREGLLREEDIAGEIGKVICGELPGRQSDDQITVFDSTGIALQDSATVPLEYERALAAGVGVEKKMIST